MPRTKKLSKTTSHKRQTYGYVASTHRFYVKTRDGWKATPRSKVPEIVVLRVAPKLVIVKRVSDKKHTYGISKTGKTYMYNRKTKMWQKRKPPQRLLERLKSRRKPKGRKSSQSRKSKGRKSSQSRKSKGHKSSQSRKSKGRKSSQSRKSKGRKSKGRKTSRGRKSSRSRSKPRSIRRHRRRKRPSPQELPHTATPIPRRQAKSRWKKVSDSLKRLTQMLRRAPSSNRSKEFADEDIDVDLDL